MVKILLGKKSIKSVVKNTPVKTRKKKVSKELVIEEDNLSDLDKFRYAMMDSITKEIQKHNPNINVWALNDPNVPTKLKRVIPTGLPGFDIISARTAMGRHGLPVGRQIEIFGEPESGKTSLACFFAAAAQRYGWNVQWLEFENKFNTEWAESLGVDPNFFKLSQPECLEDAIKEIDNIMDKTFERKDLPEDKKMIGTLIVVDSVAAIASRDELAVSKKGKGSERKGMEAPHHGVFQRKMSQAQRRITNKLSKRNITIIWLNQQRDKLGFGAFKGGKNTYGGNALKFYCAQRWSIWRQLIKGKGSQIHIVNKKNQCGAFPYGECEVFLDFRKGFDYVDSWIEAVVNLQMAKRNGNKVTISVGSHEGMEVSVKKLREMYEENPTWFKDYEKLMKDHAYSFVSRKQKKKDGNKDEEKSEDGEAEE